ncbi:MAG: DAK2 domain-containing protein [Erysipelotrichaceae bacterium]|nr:DAK2 domain-containing protein [Erysipelotrichaceae bacterium]
MNSMNCQQFREMLVSGANNLANQHEYINTLNVFPVPDGDTGTNMNMTFGSGVREVSKMMSESIGETSKALGKNMLMSARGNSGVILSQIFKGIYRSFTDKQDVTAEDFCRAFENGSKQAYKAVMRPVEGTILTVIREASEAASRYFKAKKDCDIVQYFDALLISARKSLEHTPELLPVLKEVGVVDSGGAGLVCIIEGFWAYLHGRPIKLADASDKEQAAERGYCVEIVLRVTNKDHDYDSFRTVMGKNGSLVDCVKEENEIRFHVHTLKPGDVLNRSQKEGILESIKIENIEIEHNVKGDYTVKTVENSKYAIISVVNGKGIEEMFRQLGVEHFVFGGQTMNPAAGDFVSLIKNIHADTVFILPNNSNIIMAAQRAKKVLKDRNVIVMESKSIPEGLSAAMVLNQEAEPSENEDNMMEAIREVKTGSVTNAVKDTSFNSVAIHKDDYMGICGKEIIASSKDLKDVTCKLLDSMIDEDSSYVTVIYGRGVEKALVGEIEKYVNDKYGLDCGVNDGAQDLYPFIIGVE